MEGAERWKMKITEVKINGIRNPIGFLYPYIKCSWKVTDTGSRCQQMVRIRVAEDADFKEVFYEKKGADLKSIGERLDIPLAPYTRYYVQVEVLGDNGESAVSETVFFETAKRDEPWEADFIGTEENDRFHPVFFREFEISKNVERARIYITGLGLYEAYLNGEKLGEDYLAPFCNDYHTRIQYQTYDLLPGLKQKNKIEIMTGNGWYKGRFGYMGGREIYGDRFSVIAELVIEYADGTKEKLATDDTWKYCGSDIEMSDIYDGECYDPLLWEHRENKVKQVQVLPGSDEMKQRLIERYSLPVKVKEEVRAEEVLHTPAGETVLDMGQNFTGYVEMTGGFTRRLPKGTRIVLDFGEILQQGNFYHENYRTAKSQFVYVADGREKAVRPHFTFFGFRYVRVTGWQDVRKEDFIGRAVYSDLDCSVSIETSNRHLNRLAKNCIWGQKSNFLDMPTDCPQRDERLGWTADAQVFAPTACFHMDCRTFYHKFLYDLHLDQEKHGGKIANYLPNLLEDRETSCVWGDTATFLPMTLYQYYGDEDELNANYPMMKEWVDYIIAQDEARGKKHLWDFGIHFGDWLALDGATEQSQKGGTDEYFIASMYYYESVKKTARAAGILGKDGDRSRYEKKAEDIRGAILKEYFSPNGRLTIDTQTAYLLCLRFQVYINKKKITEGLRQRFKRDCYKMKGGFVGGTVMCQVLAENGMEDLAAYFLFQKGYPGWMHCIDLGATTIWERWNSVLDDGTISGTGMNSLNHYAYGSVMEYVYRNLAGLQETEPGFTSVRFAPQIHPGLSYMNFSYDSVSGNYVSNWKLNEDGTVSVHFEVPFQCKATVVLPDMPGGEREISAGVYEETYRPERDYRKPYSMQTRLDELKDDQRAMEILRTDLPAAYRIVRTNDIENMSMTLEELQTMYWLRLNPPAVQKAAAKIRELRRL